MPRPQVSHERAHQEMLVTLIECTDQTQKNTEQTQQNKLGMRTLAADLVMRERQQTPRIGQPQQLCARSGVHVKTDLNAGGV